MLLEKKKVSSTKRSNTKTLCVKENKNKRINPKKSDRHKTDNACSKKKNAVQHKKSEKKKNSNQRKPQFCLSLLARRVNPTILTMHGN